MVLNELATIIQGNIPTRIEVEGGFAIDTLTIQELNYLANASDEFPVKKYLAVQSDKVNSYSLTQQNDVVVALNSGKAIVVDENRANKLILSNLAIIRINDAGIIDPYYLCWYINNNKTAIKKMLQGNTAVSIIPLSLLKGFEIVLLPIEKQRLIGKVNDLKRQRDRITHTIEAKKTELLSHQLIKLFEKESKDGNKRVRSRKSLY